jgi:hypothetical protein
MAPGVPAPQPAWLAARPIGMTVMEHAQAPVIHADEVFAPLDRDHHLERIGGGFQNDVYCTDDRRYVVKLTSELGRDLAGALAAARRIRRYAEAFARSLGPRATIANHYVISRDSAGHVQLLVVQPFVEHARPLYQVDYRGLTEAERAQIADQLREITWRTLAFYRRTGYMPDLYGLSSSDQDHRARLARIGMLPRHLWGFVFERNLLRSHNLMLATTPELRVVLVDYDLVPWHPRLRRVYFAVRWLLGWRDHLLIGRLRAMRRDTVAPTTRRRRRSARGSRPRAR